MRLLLDANLSWKLIRLLIPPFEEVDHIDRCDLPIPAKDTEIWEWAKSKDAIIVTSDEDFYYLHATIQTIMVVEIAVVIDIFVSRNFSLHS